MGTINRENSKEVLFHDSHSVLNMTDRALDAKVKKSTLLNFLKKYHAVLFLFIIFLAGFFLVINSPKILAPENIQNIKIAGQKIKVELALTPQEHSQGLSGRTPLKENEGMLFIFEKSGQYAFWMKDMNFPIDMIWIGENKEIIYIKKDARPESYPELYQPEQDAKYVLEVVSGFSEKQNLKTGDRVEFIY